MSYDLIGLSSLCKTNLAGLQSVEYLPTTWIDRSAYEYILAGNYNWQATIPISNGDWLKAPLVVYQNLWSEVHKPDKHGGYYDQTVNGQLAGWTPAATNELQKMENHTFLLRLTDKEKQQWILGTLEHPFRFTGNSSTGRKVGNFKGHNIRWYSKTRRRASGYVPVF